MIRPRLSLRGLLIATALAAGFCYWRDRPRQVANRFITAVEAKNLAVAEAMFDGPKRFANGESRIATWKVRCGRQSMTDWIWGRYPLRVCDGSKGFAHIEAHAMGVWTNPPPHLTKAFGFKRRFLMTYDAEDGIIPTPSAK